MNPEEELPPDVAPRAYYHQPVWKRIVVIGAGPFVNLLIAFLLLFGLAFGAPRAHVERGRVAPGSPAAAGRCSPATGSSRSTARRGDQAEPPAADLEPPLRRPTQRDRLPWPRTPAVLQVERDGRVLTLRVRPRYDPEQGRTLVGFSFATRAARSRASLEAAETLAST